MIRGYRWIKTAPDVWQFEGPSRSRHFHGMVNVHNDGRATFCALGGYSIYRYPEGITTEHGQGERDTVRLAKNEIESAVAAEVTDGK